ncbi:MAG TPA: hypothetical protein VFK21_11565 [Gammaproteobacteria bacterium]|nr:hypothetical protein [Gammaproteobacteria bacterium]
MSAVQSMVHQTDGGTSIVGVNGMVRFTVTDGAIENPEIVASTGYADLDKLMLQQVASAKPPKTWGPHAHEPHEFELLLDMLTPFDSFQYHVYRAIDAWKVYPRDPIIAGSTGDTVVDFDYLDSKAQNIVIALASKDKELNKASVNAVSKAKLPAAPPDYVGKNVHMEVVFCYTINNSPGCPAGKNVIDVRAARGAWSTVETVFGGY